MLARAASGAVLQERPLVYHAEPGTTPVSAEKQLVLKRVGGGKRVLEVGAHGGYFSALLEAAGCTVTAVEPDPRAAARAREHASRVIEGSIEDPRIQADLGGPFDVVLFMHVLEHLADPWAALRATRALAAPDAILFALVPNVACWRIRKRLFFRGAFDYEDTGILDRTHLRFFTLGSARALLADGGWDPVGVHSIDVCVPLERRLRRLPLARACADRWHASMARRFPNLCTEIVAIEARRQPEGG